MQSKPDVKQCSGCEYWEREKATSISEITNTQEAFCYKFRSKFMNYHGTDCAHRMKQCGNSSSRI